MKNKLIVLVKSQVGETGESRGEGEKLELLATDVEAHLKDVDVSRENAFIQSIMSTDQKLPRL